MTEPCYQPHGSARRLARNGLVLEVVEDAFPDVYSHALGMVCHSAAEQIYRYFQTRLEKTILIDRSALNGSLYLTRKGPEGQDVILLSPSKPGSYWAQFAYQFSNRFVQSLAAHPGRTNGDEVWLEEAICACGALFVFPRMATVWSTEPPDDYAPWIEYAPCFQEYIDNEVQQYPFLVTREEIPSWIRQHAPELNSSDNWHAARLLASQLLPLFENTPSAWNAVRYLHHGGHANHGELPLVLAQWQYNVPPLHRSFVQELARLMGVILPD